MTASQRISLAALFTAAILLGGVVVLRRSFHRVEVTTVKIGVLLPLNADLMGVATKMRNGMDLAREDLLERHRGRLRIILDYQNGCFESESAPAVQKFIHEGVSIIGGSFCLFGHIPILPLTEAFKIITFNTASNPDVVLNKRFAFSTNVEIKDEAAKMAKFAWSQVGAHRAVTMHLDTPFGHDYNKYFKREFERLGGKVLFNAPNAPDGKDYSELIPRIKAANADVIVTAHFGVPLGVFFREVRRAGITAPIVGNYETEDMDVVNAAGAASEGVMFASSEPPSKQDAAERFEKRYIRRFGVAPDAIVTNSYDDIVLGVESFLKCNGARDCMRKELHDVRGYDGASGVITIEASGAAKKPTAFKIIRNRTFILFASSEAAR
jgi:branched-chain amino acid transport system substrate-binding protein